MSGHIGPIRCCDRDCAGVNNCQIGGYACSVCGKYFCADELDEDDMCDDCADEFKADDDEDDE